MLTAIPAFGSLATTEATVNYRCNASVLAAGDASARYCAQRLVHRPCPFLRFVERCEFLFTDSGDVLAIFGDDGLGGETKGQDELCCRVYSGIFTPPPDFMLALDVNRSASYEPTLLPEPASVRAWAFTDGGAGDTYYASAETGKPLAFGGPTPFLASAYGVAEFANITAEVQDPALFVAPSCELPCPAPRGSQVGLGAFGLGGLQVAHLQETEMAAPQRVPTHALSGNCASPPLLGAPCGWYRECMEEWLPCGDSGYALSYGEVYCQRFDNATCFSDSGRAWAVATRDCLQRALVPLLASPPPVGKDACSKVAALAYRSHATCYTGNQTAAQSRAPDATPSICHLPLEDVECVLETVQPKDVFSKAGLEAVVQVALICAEQWSDVGGEDERAAAWLRIARKAATNAEKESVRIEMISSPRQNAGAAAR